MPAAPRHLALALVALSAGPAAGQEPKAAPAADEKAVAVHIAALRSPDSATRAAAAAGLRRLVAAYPSGTVYLSRPDDGGAAMWRAKLRQVRVGMDRAEVLRTLPSTEGPGAASGGLHDGGSYHATWRLDHHWTATAAFYEDGELCQFPKLHKGARWVGVVHPPDFTGTWVDYHVNGQKARAVELRAGKHHGVSTTYYDSGAKSEESHYANGVRHGDYTGWFPDGRVCFTAHYRDGKQHGTWTHRHANGVTHSVTHYRDGRTHGRDTYWHDNGEVGRISDYRHGVRHGVEASWNEAGVPHFKRRLEDGRVVETFEGGLPVE